MWDHRNSDISHSDWCDEPLDEDGVCAKCEAEFKRQRDYWYPLWLGEKKSGLLDDEEKD
jgi:hypothetical protein